MFWKIWRGNKEVCEINFEIINVKNTNGILSRKDWLQDWLRWIGMAMVGLMENQLAHLGQDFDQGKYSSLRLSTDLFHRKDDLPP
ncbi:MAG: hypothetical protein IPI30_12330 [Saprospiraceae bacterium]|nr:hypothetical protein [Candidatus Vicinibacter affinis]